MEIKKETAKRLYIESPGWFKEQLEEGFGKDFFKKRDFKDIKTFEDACKELGTSEKEFNKRWGDLGLPNDTLFYEKVKLVAKAINQGWEPDWTDSNQKKWWPYFVLSSGFGFSDSGSDYGHTAATVGSRLCFESQEKCEYTAKQFLDLYKQFLT